MSQALYQRIAASLRQRILSGGHAVGDVMPSENELAGAYRTSRVTVRKAFHILESEGLVVAKQGKGYIVQPPRTTVYTMIFDEEAGSGRFRCLEVNILPAEPEVAQALGLRAEQLVIAIRRVLEREGAPVRAGQAHRGEGAEFQRIHRSALRPLRLRLPAHGAAHPHLLPPRAGPQCPGLRRGEAHHFGKADPLPGGRTPRLRSGISDSPIRAPAGRLRPRSGEVKLSVSSPFRSPSLVTFYKFFFQFMKLPRLH